MAHSVFQYILSNKPKKQTRVSLRKRLPAFLAVSFLFFIMPQMAFGTTYFFVSAAGLDPRTTTNWFPNTNGNGTSPSNFTTAGDIFVIRPTAVAVLAGAWALGGTGGSGTAVTVIDSGTLTVSSGRTITVTGKAANSSDFIVTGTIIFQATGILNLAIGNASCSFTLSAGGTLKTANTVGVLGTSCSITQTAGSTATFDPGANYEFNGAAQGMTGMPATVNNLTLSGTLAKTLSATITAVDGNFTLSGTATTTTVVGLTIGGNLAIGNGTTFTAAGFALTVTGTTTVGAGATGVLTISSATGTKAFNGDLTVNAGGTWNNTAANASLTLPGSISNAGTFNAGSGVYTLSGASKTISGTFTIPSVTVSGTYQNNGTLTVSTALAGGGTLTNGNGATGTLNINFTGTPGISNLDASPSGNTVNYAFAGTQTLLGITYHHLGLGTSGIKTLPVGLTTINGNFTFSGTASATATIGLDIAGNLVLGTGTTFAGGAFTHNLAGNWTNNGGTFTNTGSTINFNGTTQSIGGSSSTTFNNVSTSGSTTTSTAFATTIAGTLTIGDGTTFTAAAFALTVTGTTTVGGGTSGILTISSATGTKAFNGDLTVNTGATWNNTAAVVSLTLPGNIFNAGTFNAGTGVYTLSGVSKTIGGTFTIPSLSVGASASYQNNGTLTVSTALAGTGTLTNGATGVLNINFTGTPGISSLVATASGNTVNYIFSGTQTVFNTNYDKLGLSGTSLKTLQTGTTAITGNLTLSGSASTATVVGLTIGGNLSIGDGTTFTAAGFALTVTGSTTVGGGATGSLVVSSATGAKTFVGLVTIANGATWNNSGNSALTFRGGITTTPTFTGGSGIHTFSTNPQTLTGTFSIPSMTVTTITLSNTNTVTVATDLTGTGTFVQGPSATLNIGGTSGITGLTATATGNTVNYTGGAGQTIKPVTYYDLGFSGAGLKTISTATTVTVNNNLAAGAATTLSGTANLSVTGNITGGGAITVGSGTITINGNWTNNGAFTAGTGTVNYNNGAGGQTVAGLTYNILTLSNTGGTQTASGAIIASTFNTTALGTLNMVTSTLSVTTVNHLGILQTQNVTATPITAGKSWGGTVQFNSASDQTIINGNYTNLDGTGGNRTLNGTGTVGVAGLFTPGGGTYTITGSTVDFNGTAAQSIPAFNFNNLTISGNKAAATVTLVNGGTIGVAGIFSVTATNVSYATTGNTVDFNGTGAQSIGAFNFNNLTISGAKGGATVTLINGGTIGVGGIFSATATGVVYATTGNTFDFNGTGAQSIGAFNFNNLTISGNKASNNITLVNGGTIGIAGTFSLTATSVTYITTGNTVDFNGTAAQGIPAFNFNNLTVSANKGSNNVTFINGGTVGVAGTLSLTATSVTYVTTGNTIDFNGIAAQTIPVFSFNNLTISGNKNTNAITLASGTVGIAGIFSVTATGISGYVTTGNTVDFNGTAAQSIGAFNFNNLTISGNKGGNAVTLVNGGTIGVAGIFSVTATNATYTVTNNTFDFNGTGAQSIGAFNFNNLTISGNKGGNAVTLVNGGTIGVAGIFSVTATNATYTVTNNTFNFNGTGAQSIGAFNFNNLTISGNKGSNNVTLVNGGTIGIAGIFSATATSVTYVTTGNTVDFNGTGAQTIGAFNFNNLTISGSKGGNAVTLVNGGTIGVAGTFSVTATSVTYTITNNTFDFNGTGAQTVGAFNFNNLTVSGNKNTNTITLASGTIGIAGTFSVTATGISGFTTTGNTVDFNGTTAQSIGAFNFNNLTISGNKGANTITLANAGTIGVAGVFSVTATNAVYTVTNNTFDYNGSGAQTIIAPFNYNNLVISNNGTKTITNGTLVTCFTFTMNGSANIDVPNTANSLVITQ